MKPYFRTNLGTVYHGDVLQVLPQIKKRAKLVIADFPYYIPNMKEKEYLEWAGEVIQTIDKHVKRNGYILIINNPYNMFKLAPLLQNYLLINELVVLKPTAYQVEKKFNFTHSTAWLLGRSKGHLDKDTEMSDVMLVEMGYTIGNMTHPAAISEDFFEQVITAATNEGDLVIDVFSGSGTVPAVCERLNRKWVAIELQGRYCRMIRSRVANNASQSG